MSHLAYISHFRRFQPLTSAELYSSPEWPTLSPREQSALLNRAVDINGNDATFHLNDLEHQLEVDRKFGQLDPSKTSKRNQHVPYLYGEDVYDFGQLGQPDSPESKPEILLLAVSRMSPCLSYDIAAITSDMKFRHLIFQFRSHSARHLTDKADNLFNRIFSTYRLTNRTRVMLMTSVPKNSPISLWLNFTRRHIGYDLRHKSLVAMVKRILAIHPSANLTAFTKGTRRIKRRIDDNTVQLVIEFLWKYLVDHGNCPWINPDVDTKLSKMTVRMRTRSMRPYLMLYYMAASARRVQATLQSEARRAARAAAKSAYNLPEQTQSGEETTDEA